MVWIPNIVVHIALLWALIRTEVFVRLPWFTLTISLSLLENFYLYRAVDYDSAWWLCQFINVPFYIMSIRETTDIIIRLSFGTYLTLKSLCLSLYVSWFYSRIFYWKSHRALWLYFKWAAHHVLDFQQFLNLVTLGVLAWYVWKKGEPSVYRSEPVPKLP